MKNSGLGRGLSALMELNDSEGEISQVAKEKEIDINLIDINKEQARKKFDEEKLKELSESIKIHGIIQPLVLKENAGRYTIVAGERRYRAARLAGLKTVPAVVKDIDNEALLEISIIENIQREDLNPLEEARAIAILMKEHGYTQEKASERIGRSRSAIANTLRLLTLPDFVQEKVEMGVVSAGHARALIPLKEKDKIEDALNYITTREFSVRDTEKYIAKLLANQEQKQKKVKQEKTSEFSYAEKSLSEALETKVRIEGNLKRGKISIDYYSEDQLDALFRFLTERT